MSTLSKLYIQVSAWNNEAQDHQQVGTVIYDNDPDHRLGFVGFVYDREYLAAGGPDLDPVNLKTTENEGRFFTSNDGRLPPYFKQFLPGVFAEQMLSDKDSRWGSLNDAEKLYLLTEVNGDFGAIQLNAQMDQFDRPIDRMGELKELVEIIRDFQQDRSTPPLNNSQIKALTAFNGHKPKAEIEMSMDGVAQRFCAKLNTTPEYNDAKVSHTLTEMQKVAGISSAGGQVATLSSSEDIYLSAHYARTESTAPRAAGESPDFLRYNRVPLTALLHGDESLGNTDIPSYKHVANLVSRISADAPADQEQLFKRALFSALTNHTANGLDNIEMYDVGNGQWRLSPSFNNLPNPSQTARFDLSFTGNKDTVDMLRVNSGFVRRLGAVMGFGPEESMALANSVTQAVLKADKIMVSSDLPPNDRIFLARTIRRAEAENIQLDINRDPDVQAILKSQAEQDQTNTAAPANIPGNNRGMRL